MSSKTKLEKMADELNAEFGDALDRDFMVKFGVVVTTGWNFVKNRLMTARGDGEALAREHSDYLQAYSSGYAAAMARVRARAMEDRYLLDEAAARRERASRG